MLKVFLNVITKFKLDDPSPLSKIVLSSAGYCQLDITNEKIDFKFIDAIKGKLDSFSILKK